MEIINLTLKSEYSFKKVFQRVTRICDNQKIAVGIADINSTQGHPGLDSACKLHGIKPIFGVNVMAVHDVEARPKNPGPFGFTYIVLAKNNEGLAEIYRLVKKAYDNFYYRPIVSLVDIWMLSENVFVISEAFEIPERVDYIGLSVVTDMRMMQRYNLPTVALNNNTYPAPDDLMAYELLTGSRFMNHKTHPQHLLSTDEWMRLFDDRQSVERTHIIADQCNANLRIAEPVKYRGDETLRGLINKGIKLRKYPMNKEIKKRIKTELELIEDKNYTDYFLVVSQMTTEAKKNWMVGPGRGSSGGSLVCYLIGITEVDPIPYDLLFARFIDKNRHDAPDIDIDFPDNCRDDIIKTLSENNGGPEHVAHLSTVSRLRGDSLINQLRTELDIPFEDANELKEILIQRPAGDLRVNECVYDTVTTTEIGKKFAKKYPEVLEASKYEGHAINPGTHAAGILICNEPVTNFVGVNSRDGLAMIDYREAEIQNLLKIDVLGLKTLTVLQECATLAGFHYSDYYNKVDLNDEAALEVFRNGRLNGIFQFEGMALSGLCRQIKVKNFEEIAALTALCRPGPLHGGGTEKYVSRHQGKEMIEYIADHPVIIENTKNTYGVIVYQEQLMHICRGLGMSWKKTSAFRRVVSKRKGKELLGTFETYFLKCAKKSGLKKIEAQNVWNTMVTFGSYGFNKSHAVAYAMISLHCAWAKAHHPLEFAVACLNNSNDNEDAARLLRDFVRHDKLKYIPVDPDESQVKWSIKNGVMLGGLTNIHGIADTKARTIVRNRKSGKADTASISAMLVYPETPFDILFPCEEFWGDFYVNPQEYELPEPPSMIEDIQEKGRYTFIGKLLNKKIKDLNTDEEIAKRDGNVYDEDTVCLNVAFEDDTGEIRGRISRGNFDQFAHEIIERDDCSEHGDCNWYIVKGNIIDDGIHFIFINNIHFLGEEH